MNIVSKVTLENLKRNKKRTIVTILGAIISVAMLTAVATLCTSFMVFMKTHILTSEGLYYATYEGVTYEDYENVKEIYKDKGYFNCYTELGYMKYDDPVENKSYLRVEALNNKGFDDNMVKLVEGRLPENDHEIIIPNQLVEETNNRFKVGDKINYDILKLYTVDVESGEEYELSEFEGMSDGVNERKICDGDYTITGIYNSTVFDSEYTNNFKILTYFTDDNMKAADVFDMKYVTYKLNGKIYDTISEISTNIKSPYLFYYGNNDFIRYQGYFDTNSKANKSLITIAAILFSIIIVGSVSLIYNSFAISLSERSKQLGMLASVGATKAQKRKSVLVEGLFVGVISIPVGIAAGIVGIGLTLKFLSPIMTSFLNDDVEFKLSIMPWGIVLTVILAAITIFVSAIVPAFKASRISVIDAIRQTNDIKIKGRQVKTSKLTQLIFGFEATLALKNLKRNKKRYIATLASLILSLVLFITVTTGIGYIKEFYIVAVTQIGCDVVEQTNSSDNTAVTDMNNYKELLTEYKTEDYMDPRISGIIGFSTIRNSVLIPEDKINKDLVNSQNMNYWQYSECEGGNASIFASFIALDDLTLKEYAKECGVSYEDLNDTNAFNAIMFNSLTYKSEGKLHVVDKFDFKDGSELEMIASNPDVEPIKIKSLKVTDKVPLTYFDNDFEVEVKYFVSYSTFDRLREYYNSNNQPVFPCSALLINTDNPTEICEELNTKLTDAGDTQSSYINYTEQSREINNTVVVFQVFAYGFICLITLICLANMFNTISTSVALRRREFAMIKSVGMTPRGFNKMIIFESLFYGIKAFIYGLPISIVLVYFLNNFMTESYDLGYFIKPSTLIIAVIAVFAFVGIIMVYSVGKLRNDNIVDTLKNENV